MKQFFFLSLLLTVSYQAQACLCATFEDAVEKNYEASALVIWGKVISIELVDTKIATMQNQEHAPNFLERFFQQAKGFFKSPLAEEAAKPFESYIDSMYRNSPSIFWNGPEHFFGGELKIKVLVSEKYKGNVDSRIVTIYTDASSSSCGYTNFHVNVDFIIYAINGLYENGSVKYYTGLCSGNKPTERSEIEELRKLAGYEAPKEAFPFQFHISPKKRTN